MCTLMQTDYCFLFFFPSKISICFSLEFPQKRWKKIWQDLNFLYPLYSDMILDGFLNFTNAFSKLIFYLIPCQILVKHAEAAEEGKKLMDFLSTSSTNITLFVPHNEGFSANEVSSLSANKLKWFIMQKCGYKFVGCSKNWRWSILSMMAGKFFLPQ